MQIDNNEKEIQAMALFKAGRKEEGSALQQEFLNEFHEEYAHKDHCPCKNACRRHGNCKDCIAIHRAHAEHVPVCLQPMLNKYICAFTELTEGTTNTDRTGTA